MRFDSDGVNYIDHFDEQDKDENKDDKKVQKNSRKYEDYLEQLNSSSDSLYKRDVISDSDSCDDHHDDHEDVTILKPKGQRTNATRRQFNINYKSKGIYLGRFTNEDGNERVQTAKELFEKWLNESKTYGWVKNELERRKIRVLSGLSGRQLNQVSEKDNNESLDKTIAQVQYKKKNIYLGKYRPKEHSMKRGMAKEYIEKWCNEREKDPSFGWVVAELERLGIRHIVERVRKQNSVQSVHKNVVKDGEIKVIDDLNTMKTTEDKNLFTAIVKYDEKNIYLGRYSRCQYTAIVKQAKESIQKMCDEMNTLPTYEYVMNRLVETLNIRNILRTRDNECVSLNNFHCPKENESVGEEVAMGSETCTILTTTQESQLDSSTVLSKGLTTSSIDHEISDTVMTHNDGVGEEVAMGSEACTILTTTQENQLDSSTVLSKGLTTSSIDHEISDTVMTHNDGVSEEVVMGGEECTILTTNQENQLDISTALLKGLPASSMDHEISDTMMSHSDDTCPYSIYLITLPETGSMGMHIVNNSIGNCEILRVKSLEENGQAKHFGVQINDEIFFASEEIIEAKVIHHDYNCKLKHVSMLDMKQWSESLTRPIQFAVRRKYTSDNSSIRRNQDDLQEVAHGSEKLERKLCSDKENATATKRWTDATATTRWNENDTVKVKKKVCDLSKQEIESALKQNRFPNVPYCRKCKGIEGIMFHHFLCPMHHEFDSTGAKEKLKILIAGVSYKCDACIEEYESGKRSNTPHNSKCGRSRSLKRICMGNDEHKKKKRPMKISSLTEREGYTHASLPNKLKCQTVGRKAETSNRKKTSKINSVASVTPVASMQGFLNYYKNEEAKAPILLTDACSVPIWTPCPNPWGDRSHTDGDFVLVSPSDYARALEYQGPRPLRFTMNPFEFETSPYYQTHKSSLEGCSVLQLKRDCLALRSWGFTFSYHDFGGACLVTEVEPLSPAEGAVSN